MYQNGAWGSLVDPFSQFRGTPIYPTSFMQLLYSLGQMRLFRLYAQYLYYTNPTAFGVIKSKRNYVYGTGFTYTVQAKPGERVAEGLQKQAQGILDTFLEANEWDIREPETYTRCHRDGECIYRLFPSDDDDYCADLRTIEPDQIIPQDASPEWRMGVHTAFGDSEKVIGYGVSYDGATVDEVEPAEIQFIKINTDLAIPRGLTSLFTPGELLKGTQNLMRATVEGESVRQAIAYIIEHALAPLANVTALANANTNTNTVTFNGNSIPTERIVPGCVPEVNEGQLYKPPPVGSAENGTKALTSAFNTLGAYFNVPQWMVSGDTGSTNFAASLTAESPLVKDTLSEQKFYSNQNIKLFTKALKIAEYQGRLPEGTVKRLKIYAEMPSPAVRDAQKETDQNKILSDNGIISKKTWSEREDVDFEQERENLKDEPKPLLTDPKTPPSTDPSAVYKQETAK